jgi:hypothetical protein
MAHYPEWRVERGKGGEYRTSGYVTPPFGVCGHGVDNSNSPRSGAPRGAKPSFLGTCPLPRIEYDTTRKTSPLCVKQEAAQSEGRSVLPATHRVQTIVSRDFQPGVAPRGPDPAVNGHTYGFDGSGGGLLVRHYWRWAPPLWRRLLGVPHGAGEQLAVSHVFSYLCHPGCVLLLPLLPLFPRGSIGDG